MTVLTDGPVVLAELCVVHFMKFKNQRLSSWGKPFPYSSDPLIYPYQNINDGLPASARTNSAGILSTSADFPYCRLNSSRSIGSSFYTGFLIAVQNLHCRHDCVVQGPVVQI